jgi:hypothetical protein
MEIHVIGVGQPPQGRSHSFITTIEIIVGLAQLHLFLMAISVPAMVCIPGGCFSSGGYIRTVSDGLRDNSVLATTLWGSGMTWVTATRYLGIICSSPTYVWVAHISIILATYASFLTLRYDMFEIYHVLSAVVWIVSSFLFHFSTTIHKLANRSSFALYILCLGVILGIVFVTLFSIVEFKIGPLELFSSTGLLSIISVLEVATVLCIMALDFLQSLHLVNELQVYVY